MGDARTKIIYHCGSYKTGSSSIQGALHANAHKLREAGVLYPETGIRFDLEELGQRHAELARDPSPDMMYALRDEIMTSGCSTVIMSSEAWSDVNHHLSLLSLMGVMRGDTHFDHSAVLYLRNIYDYAVKHYREFTLRWHNQLTFPKYVAARRHIFDYLLIAQRLNHTFSGHETQYYCYENVGDVVGHFSGVAGISHVSLGTNDEGPKRYNRGRGALETELYRLINAKLARHQVNKIDREKIVREHPFEEERNAYLEDFSALNAPFTKSWSKQMRAYCSLTAAEVEQISEMPDFTKTPIVKIRPALAAYVDKALAKEFA